MSDRRSTIRKRINCVDAAIEALECRRLFSTIDWVDRDSTLNFQSFLLHFGSAANANIARGIIDRAVDDWEAVIANFHHSDGGNTYELTLGLGPLPGGIRAQGGPTEFDNDDVPTAGEITLDHDAGGAGWYLDPVAADDGEFANILSLYHATAAGITGNDLYRTTVHEIGHCLGMTSNPNARLSQFLTDLGVDDPASSNPGNLFAFNVNGGAIEATFTNSDPGHLYEGPAIPNRPDIPFHPNDLMNSGRTSGDNSRKLISNTDARVLRDAYGYTVVMPSTINTFYVNKNGAFVTVTGNLRLDGIPDDVINLNPSGNSIRIDVNGVGETIDGTILGITINAGTGPDLITVVELPDTTPVYVNAPGAGSILNLVGDDNSVLGDVITIDGQTINGHNVDTFNVGSLILDLRGGPDLVFFRQISAGLNLTVLGGEGNDQFQFERTSGGASITVFAGNGDDTCYIGSNGILSDVKDNITFNGDGDSDLLILDNTLSQTRYNFFAGPISVTAIPESSYARVFSFSDVSTVELRGGGGADQFATFGQFAHALNAFGYDGNDSFAIGGGNLLAGVTNLNAVGGNGTDTLVLDDSQSTHTFIWTIEASTVFLGLAAFGYSTFEGLTILGGLGASRFVYEVASVPFVTVNGGGGDDRFDVYANVFTQLRIEGGFGNDLMTVDPDSLVMNGVYDVTFSGGNDIDALYLNDANQPVVENGAVMRYTQTGTTLKKEKYITATPSNTYLTASYDSSLENVFWFTGVGNDSVFVQGTALGTRSEVNNNGGTDGYAVGNTVNGLNDLLGTEVYFRSGAGNAQLQINDAADTTGDIATLYDDGNIRLLDMAPSQVVWNPNEIGSILVLGGQGHDQLTVNSLHYVADRNRTMFDLGGGDDTFTVNNFTNLGAGIVQGNVSVIGNSGNDRLFVNNTTDTTVGDDGRAYYGVGSNDINQAFRVFGFYVPHRWISHDQVERVQLHAGSSPDQIWVNGIDPDITRMEVNGGGGVDDIEVEQNTSNSDTVVTHSVGPDNVLVETNAFPGRLRIEAGLELNALTITDAGRAYVVPSQGTLRVHTFAASGSGTLDLNNNPFVIDYDGASPLAAIKSYIANAYANDTWNGAGITSTNAASSGNAVGYAEASALFGSFPAPFGGQQVDNTAVLVRYTRYGDANLDQQVNLADFNRLAAGFGTGNLWSQGDFNYDNSVSLADFNLLAANFGVGLGDGVALRPSTLPFSNERIANLIGLT